MKKIHHIGLAVVNLEKTIRHYERTFNAKVIHQEELPESKISLAFIEFENTIIELLVSSDPHSSLNKFISSRGPGLHHICFEVKDIKAELQRLKDQGQLLIDHTPRCGAMGSQIAFVHPKSNGGVLIELCQPK